VQKLSFVGLPFLARKYLLILTNHRWLRAVTIESLFVTECVWLGSWMCTWSMAARVLAQRVPGYPNTFNPVKASHKYFAQKHTPVLLLYKYCHIAQV